MANTDINTVMRSYERLQASTDAHFSGLPDRQYTSSDRPSEGFSSCNGSRYVKARKNTTKRSIFDKSWAFLCCGSSVSLDEPTSNPVFTPSESEESPQRPRFPTHIPESSSIYSTRGSRASPPPSFSTYSTYAPQRPRTSPPPSFPDFSPPERAVSPPKTSNPPPPPPSKPPNRRNKYQFEDYSEDSVRSEAPDIREIMAKNNPCAAQRAAKIAAQEAERARLEAERVRLEGEQARKARFNGKYEELRLRMWTRLPPPST